MIQLYRFEPGKEFSIKTEQELCLFDIFIFDGAMHQKIGRTSDLDVCETIEWDDSAKLVDFDPAKVTYFQN